jgi:sulfonate transport system substrate-binding protein
MRESARKVWVGVVWMLLAAACSGEPAKLQPGAAGVTVRIGYQKSGAPFLLKSRSEALAQQLRERGASLEWLEFHAGPALLEAMRAGAVDIGYVGETPPVFAQAGGVPFVYVGVEPGAPGAEAILVHADSPIARLEDLRGKRVVLNRGSNVHYLLLRALERAGLQLSDIQLTFLAPADARAAFDSRQLDAWVIWDPFFAAAELAGARALKDGEGLVDNHQFYVARREFAAAQAPLLSLVLTAFDELGQWAAANPEQAAKLNAASSGVAYDALLRAEKRHAYGMRPITAEITAKQQKIADAFVRVGALPRAIDTASATLAAEARR